MINKLINIIKLLLINIIYIVITIYYSLYSSTVEHNTVNIMINVRFILGANEEY